MNNELLEKISVAVFIDGNVLVDSTPFNHEGEGALWSCHGRGKKFIVKRTKIWEALNQQYAQKVGIGVPKVYGWCEDPADSDRIWLVMELVDGERLEDVYKRDISSHTQTFEEAVITLAQIHSSKGILNWFCSDAERLFERGTANITKRLGTIERAFGKYKEYYKENHQSPNIAAPEIEKLCAKIDPQDLGRRLFIEGEVVFQHGDYKPNNIIITDSGIIILDWPSSGPGTPWYDLAYLFSGVEFKDAEPFIKTYVGAAHSLGLLGTVDDEAIPEMFRAGRIYQEVIRANSNANAIIKAADVRPHNIKQYEVGIKNALRILVDGL